MILYLKKEKKKKKKSSQSCPYYLVASILPLLPGVAFFSTHSLFQP